MDIDFNNIDENLLLEDERIANYIQGKMTEDEAQAFLQELKANADLRVKAIAMARMVKGMQEVGTANDKELIDEFCEIDAEEAKAIAKQAVRTKEVNTTKTIPLRKTWTRVLAVAASFALLIWAGIGYHDYRKTTGIGEEYATAFASSQFIRGAGDNAEVEMKLAKLYENVAAKKDLKNTIHELEYCWELATQDTYNDYTDYAPEIGWNLAIGHLKKNDKKNARKVLLKLTNIAPAGTAIGDKARELLGKVEEL